MPLRERGTWSRKGDPFPKETLRKHRVHPAKRGDGVASSLLYFRDTSCSVERAQGHSCNEQHATQNLGVGGVQ